MKIMIESKIFVYGFDQYGKLLNVGLNLIPTIKISPWNDEANVFPHNDKMNHWVVEMVTWEDGE